MEIFGGDVIAGDIVRDRDAPMFVVEGWEKRLLKGCGILHGMSVAAARFWCASTHGTGGTMNTASKVEVMICIP